MLRSRRILLATALLAASAIRAERLPVRAYTTADGLARDQVLRIVPDSRGFLWFVTSEGLSRFDGYSFSTYAVQQGLDVEVTDLLETRAGEHLVSTLAGIYRFEPAVADRPPSAAASDIRFAPILAARVPVAALVEDRDGTIFCATQDGLARLVAHGGRWTFDRIEIPWIMDGAPWHRTHALAEDPAGNLWIGTTSGLYRRSPDGEIQLVHLSQRPIEDVRTIHVASDGSLWFGLADVLVHGLPGLETPQADYGLAEGLPSVSIVDIFESKDSTLWVATVRGLAELVPGAATFRSYSLPDGLTDDNVTTITEDGAGNLWVGTESGGAMKIVRHGFTSFAESDGLARARIGQLLEDQDGRLIAVDSGGTLDVFDGRRFTAVTPKVGRDVLGSWGWYQFVLRDRAGEWWYPTGSGVFRFPAVTRAEDLATTAPLQVITQRDGLGGDEVFRLFEDSFGDVWIGTFSAPGRVLTRWERATGRLVPEPLDPVHIAFVPTAFREDRAGYLWIGLYDGTVLRTRRGRDAEIVVAPGEPLGLVRAIELDGAGRLWIASERGGLARIDDPGAPRPVMRVMTTKDGLSSNNVSCIVDDGKDRLWIGTGRGVDRLDVKSGHVEHFTVADGIANSFVNVGLRDHEGALWFGTLRGLSRLVPRAEKRVAPPPAWITDVRVSGRAWPISELGERQVAGIVLSPDERRLELSFLAVSFVPGETLRYQWRLEGLDNGWTPPATQRTVTYDHLASGTYRFLVRAVTADGLTSDLPAEVGFRVSPPFWRSWWFLLAGVVGVGIVVRGMHQRQVQRLLELERVRTRIASDLHDDIGAGLSQVAILSELAQRKSRDAPPQVVNALERIAVVSRELVDSMSDIVWAVDPRRDALGDLVHRMRRFANDVFTAKDVAFTFESHVGDEELKLPADLRRQVYLVFKEAVNNAARHSNCSVARVRLERSGSPPAITLRVEDDGIGFELDGESTGVGLASLVNRARAMGGTLDLSSVEGQGTRVTLVAPLKRAR